MPSTQGSKSLQKEARLVLAKHALQNNQISSLRKAESAYDTPKSTLHDRLKGATPRSESNLRKRKLKLSEEEALVKWILDLD